MTRGHTPTGTEGRRTFSPSKPIGPEHVIQFATITEIDSDDELLTANRKKPEARPLPGKPDVSPPTNTAGTSHNKTSAAHNSKARPLTTHIPPSTNTAGSSQHQHHHLNNKNKNNNKNNHKPSASSNPIAKPKLLRRRRNFSYELKHERYLAELFAEPNALEVLRGSADRNSCYANRAAVHKSIVKRFNDRFSTEWRTISLTESQVKNKLRWMQAGWKRGLDILDGIEKGLVPLGLYKSKEEKVMAECHFFFIVRDQWSGPQNPPEADQPVFTTAQDGSSVSTVNGETTLRLDRSGNKVEEEKGQEREEGEEGKEEVHEREERERAEHEREEHEREEHERDEHEREEHERDEHEREEHEREEQQEEEPADDRNGVGSDDEQEAAAGDSSSTLNELIADGRASDDRQKASADDGSSRMNEPIEEGGASDLGDEPVTWDNQHSSCASTKQKKRPEIPDHGSTVFENLDEQAREGLYLKRRKLELEETAQAEQQALIRMQRELLRLQVLKLERELVDEERRRKLDLENESYRQETEKLKLEVERKKILMEQSQLDKAVAQGQGGKGKEEIQANLNVEATLHICPAPSMHHLHGTSKLSQVQ